MQHWMTKRQKKYDFSQYRNMYYMYRKDPALCEINVVSTVGNGLRVTICCANVRTCTLKPETVSSYR